MLFENNNVLHQLRCGGVLEAVRISCAGFPTKTPYPDFVDHFWNLVPELLSNEQLDDMALSKAVLKKANLQGYQCGLNKVPQHTIVHLSTQSKCMTITTAGLSLSISSLGCMNIPPHPIPSRPITSHSFNPTADVFCVFLWHASHSSSCSIVVTLSAVALALTLCQPESCTRCWYAGVP